MQRQLKVSDVTEGRRWRLPALGGVILQVEEDSGSLDVARLPLCAVKLRNTFATAAGMSVLIGSAGGSGEDGTAWFTAHVFTREHAAATTETLD